MWYVVLLHGMVQIKWSSTDSCGPLRLFMCHILLSWLQDINLIFLYRLTLYTLASVYKFSILFSIHSPRCWQREFLSQSRASSTACMMIISFILMTSMFDSAVILYGEIRLLSRVRGLKMSVTIIIDLNWQVWLWTSGFPHHNEGILIFRAKFEVKVAVM